MSTTLKVILGITIGALLLCALAGGSAALALRSARQMLGSAFVSDPVGVENVAWQIADFDLPAGFDAGQATQAAGMNFVSYTWQDGHSHIMLFQLPAGVQVDQAEIERRFQQTARQARSGERQARVVDEIPVTVCGQETLLVISEGVNSDGQTYREALGVFPGRGGQALALYEMPADAWDDAAMQAFFASIAH